MTTNDLIQFLLGHREAFLFAWVLAQQAGLPIPGSPLLLAAGSLASVGRMNLAWSVALAWAACLIADCLWYLIGRWHGPKLLQHLGRISPELQSWVRRINAITRGRGVDALLFSKFVPGLNFAAPPLAGTLEVSLIRFLVLDSFASVLWASGYMGLGYVFGGQFARAAAFSSKLNTIPVVVLIVATAAFISFKIARAERRVITARAGETSIEPSKRKRPTFASVWARPWLRAEFSKNTNRREHEKNFRTVRNYVVDFTSGDSSIRASQ